MTFGERDKLMEMLRTTLEYGKTPDTIDVLIKLVDHISDLQSQISALEDQVLTLTVPPTTRRHG